jgi:hypothetical protein
MRLTQDLPPIPSLTQIDGGADGFILDGVSGPDTGLTVAGSGVVLNNLHLRGLQGQGVRILGSASDVHLFQMRITDGGTGIRIDPGASDDPHDSREQEHGRYAEPEPRSPELIRDGLDRTGDGRYNSVRRQTCRRP